MTVKGAAKENKILFLRGPILCMAINNKVSPKKIPITPDTMMMFKYSMLIVFQEFCKLA